MMEMNMGHDRHYGSFIWTNHALSRLSDRGMTQHMVWQTIRTPDSTSSDRDGATRYLKQQGHHTITAVVKENERYEKVILSCWMDPPLPGTADARKKASYRAYQKASPFMKILLTIKNQLGF